MKENSSNDKLSSYNTLDVLLTAPVMSFNPVNFPSGISLIWLSSRFLKERKKERKKEAIVFLKAVH